MPQVKRVITQDEYSARLQTYDQLLKLVEKSIYAVAEKKGLKLHAIRCRLKTYASFSAKIERKQYDNPWRQCDDIAALRIICLFEDQVSQIVNALNNNENLLVVESKKKKKHMDQFSYTAYHMIVQHKEVSKDFVCEIQIRTILQDAWSEMEHYVNYKQLSLDDKSQRKINALAALFEVAEDQFKEIYESFQKLQAPQIHDDVEVSAAAIYQYAKKEFASAWNYTPDANILESKEEYEAVAQLAQEVGIITMGDFVKKIKQKSDQVLAHDTMRAKEILNSPRQWPKLFDKVKATGHFYSPAIIIKRCLE